MCMKEAGKFTTTRERVVVNGFIIIIIILIDYFLLLKQLTLFSLCLFKKEIKEGSHYFNIRRRTISVESDQLTKNNGCEA